MSNKMKLTAGAVKRLWATGKDEFFTDRESAGFYLRMSKKGTKSYGFKYQLRGRTHRYRIGSAEAWTADEARREARRLRAEVDAGGNPSKDRQKDRKAETVGQLWKDFLHNHAIPHKRPRSVEEDKRNWRNHLEPRLAHIPLKDMTRRDVMKMMEEMRVTPGAANRTLALLKTMLGRAVHREIITANPCGGVKPYKEKGKEIEPLTDGDFGKVMDAIDEEVRTGDPSAAVALELLISTGARKSEVLNAKWDQLEETADGGMVWVIPGDRNKQGKVNRKPLFPEIAERIREWKPIGRKVGVPWLFESPKKPGKRRGDLRSVWKRIRQRTGFAELCIHDLRHHFIGSRIAKGYSPEVVGRYAGHQDVRTTMKYVHLADRHMAEMVSAAGEDYKRARQMPRKPQSDKVVPLKKQG